MTNCLLSAQKWKLILLRYFFLKTQLNNTAKFKPTAIIHISLYENKHGSHIKCVARLFFNICQRIIETKYLTVMWVEHCKIIFYLKQWTTISMSRRIALEIAYQVRILFQMVVANTTKKQPLRNALCRDWYCQISAVTICVTSRYFEIWIDFVNLIDTGHLNKEFKHEKFLECYCEIFCIHLFFY